MLNNWRLTEKLWGANGLAALWADLLKSWPQQNDVRERRIVKKWSYLQYVFVMLPGVKMPSPPSFLLVIKLGFTAETSTIPLKSMAQSRSVRTLNRPVSARSAHQLTAEAKFIFQPLVSRLRCFLTGVRPLFENICKHEYVLTSAS